MKQKSTASADERTLDDLINGDDSQRPTGDKLDRAKAMVRECRDLELEIADLQETIKLKSQRVESMKNRELVDLFDEVGVTNIGLEAEGNVPPYEIEIQPYYHANIKVEDNPDAPKAFAYLRKVGEADMIKTTYTVSFGMGESKKQKAFETMLRKAAVAYDSKFGVPWNTLTAWLKRQVEVEKKTPPLQLLGATVGRRANVKKSRKKGSN